MVRRHGSKRGHAHLGHETLTSVGDVSVVFECITCGAGWARPRCERVAAKTGERCKRACYPGGTACSTHLRADRRSQATLPVAGAAS